MVCGLLFLMLTLAFPSGTRLLGDGELHVRELIGGVWDSHPKMNRSPLLFWLLHQVRSWSFVSPDQIYPWVSRMAGIVFVLLSFTAGRCFAPRPDDRGLLILCLLSQGYVALFFGYAENYPILFPLLLGYSILCLRAMEGEGPVYQPAVLLGLTVPLHFTAFAYAPALIWVVWRRQRANAADRILSMLSLLAVPATTFLSLALIGISPFSLPQSALGSHLLPWGTPGPGLTPYAVLSAEHLIDTLNQYALVVPVVVMGTPILVLGSRRSDATDVLLLAMALPPVLFTVLFNPAIGAFRGWDVFALPSVPLVLLAGRSLLRVCQPVRLRRLAVLVISVCSVHPHSGLGRGQCRCRIVRGAFRSYGRVGAALDLCARLRGRNSCRTLPGQG